MQELLNTPDDDRNEAWEDQFLLTLTEQNLRILSPDSQAGPDGWPYLLVETTNDGEPAQKILQWLAQRGIGLAVNPSKDAPDFTLSWGMIWNFRETGKFIDRHAPLQTGSVQFSKDQMLQHGAPSAKYLPDYVKSILKDFFRDQGLHHVRILVFTLDGKNYELAFSLESLGKPPEKEHAGIAEALGWFLPTHYSLVLISEANLPKFIEL